MFTAPLDDGVRHKDTRRREPVAVHNYPVFNAVVVPDDEFARVDGATQCIEVQVVANVGPHASRPQLANDCRLPGALPIGSEIFVELLRSNVALKRVQNCQCRGKATGVATHLSVGANRPCAYMRVCMRHGRIEGGRREGLRDHGNHLHKSIAKPKCEIENRG